MHRALSKLKQQQQSVYSMFHCIHVPKSIVPSPVAHAGASVHNTWNIHLHDGAGSHHINKHVVYIHTVC